jgi:His-Xaa-Ser system radical SAM maturase HxsC
MEIPLTFRCNNNCISCIIDSRLSTKTGHLPWSEIKQRIDRLPKSCDTVGITGGEPTITGNFFKAMAYLRDRRPGILVFLVSNGRMFSYPEFAKGFSNLGIRNLRVGIAIYSHDPVVHESITMSQGSWQQTIQGIKTLLGLGIRVELRIIVNRLNYASLDETARFISANLKGVERVVFINMKYTGNAFRNRREIFIRYSELAPYITRAASILLKSGIDVRLFHFPLCTLPEKYRELAKGVTKQKAELAFAKACKTCKSKKDCPMIWRTYLTMAGEEEFRPV